MIKAVLVIAEVEEGKTFPLSGLPCPGDVLNVKLKGEWRQLRVMHTEQTTSDEASCVHVMPRVHCVQIAETESNGQ